MNQEKSTQISLGILGGGQLSQMLVEAGNPLGLKISVLTGQPDDPAAQVCGNTQIGSAEEIEVLKRFLGRLNFVTFESEFINTKKLRAALPDHVQVFPHIEALEKIQDRLTQKELLDQFKIPTSPWLPVRSHADLKEAKKRFPKGYVLKKRRFGYDGYGTFIFKNGEGDESILEKDSNGFIAEEFIPFRRELALSVVRSKSHGFQSLPLVESVQVDSRCFSVEGPVRNAKAQMVDRGIRRMMNALDYQGILAIELFETRAGHLLVNELAPRVHNSAHYSQEALTCSQFEYHLRAGLDWPLPRVEMLRKGFAMLNLLGEGGEVGLSRKPLGALHWYGKKDNRRGRKLGHINTLGANPKAALKTAKLWRKDFKL